MERPLNEFAEWEPRQVVIATLVAVGIALSLYLVYLLRIVAFALFSAILLSTAVRPASDWLQKRGLSRTFSVLLVFLVVLAALAVFFVGLVPIFGETGLKLSDTLRVYYYDVRMAMIESPSMVIRELAYSLPWSFSGDLPAGGAGTGAEDTLDQAFTLARQTIVTIFLIGAILLLTFFWALEREKALRSILLFFPAGRRDAIYDLYLEIERSVGSYLRGLLLLSLSIAVLAFIAYLLIGLPNTLFLAVVAGVFEAIPMIGPWLGAIPALLVAVTVDPSKVIWVIVANLAIQQIEQLFLVPRVMRQSAGINGFVTLLALAAFGSIFGLPGAILAIPIAVVLQLILQRFVLAPEKVVQAVPEGRDYASKLRYEAQELVKDIRMQVRAKEDDLEGEADEIEESIEVLANDLDGILAALPSADASEAAL